MAVKTMNLVGDEYGQLTVLAPAGRNKHGVSLWLCRCTCGVEKIVSSMDMRKKKNPTQSCGCHRAASLLAGRTALHATLVTHGKTKTREYHIWANMIYRCHTPSATQYDNYGGRGIYVCQRWRDSVEAFLADMGPAPTPQHTLDRHPDNDGPYSPYNCRWATPRQQALNRRDNRILEYAGRSMTMQEWAEEAGLDKATFHGRLRRNWPMEQIMTTPPRPMRRAHRVAKE